MVEVLLLVMVAVHLHFEWRVWVVRQEDVFAKYHGPSMERAEGAKRAYLAKAVWLLGLVLLQYGGIPFRDALVFSFALYTILLLVLFPVNRYLLLNAVLAAACLAEWGWGFLR